MPSRVQKTLFAFDLGATNWRLYRTQYAFEGSQARLISEPSPSPLTSFVDRKLPAVLLLSQEGGELESYGEVAQSQIDSETNRGRIRDYFKPCVGAHLDDSPQPHQKRYTHTEALEFTRLMLDAVLAQLKREKWRTGVFDERSLFSFAFPVHWQTDHGGSVLADFSEMVRGCFPPIVQDGVRFVTEPEGAILSLQRQGLLSETSAGYATLIIDVGGSTTDLVAGEVDPSTGELLFIGRYGEGFGGGHFDVEVAKSLADELLIPASALIDDPTAMLSLRVVGARLKESLSRQMLFQAETSYVPQRTVTLVMRDGEIYRGVVTLDADRFLSLTTDLSHRFENLIEEGLKSIGLGDDEIGQIVLVGGGAQLFSLYSMLQDRFEGKDLQLADNPEESVVTGVSLEYGAALSRARPSLIFLPEFEPAAEGKSEAITAEEPVYQLVSNEGVRFALIRGENRIGRSPMNEVHVDGEKISRFHARAEVKDEGVVITDLGSTNGTFVNGRRIDPNSSHLTQPRDEIRFGDITFIVESLQ